MGQLTGGTTIGGYLAYHAGNLPVITYDFTVKTASYSAIAGYGYFIDVPTSGSVTVTLPLSPSPGDMLEIWHVGLNDDLGQSATLTIARNGQNIMGIADNLNVDKDETAFKMLFLNSTYGWRVGVL